MDWLPRTTHKWKCIYVILAQLGPHKDVYTKYHLPKQSRVHKTGMNKSEQV